MHLSHDRRGAFDEKVDHVAATFPESLAAYAAGAAPWTLANVPCSGRLHEGGDIPPLLSQPQRSSAMHITHLEDAIVPNIADEASAAPSFDLPARKEVSMRILGRFKASAGQGLLEVLVVVVVFGGALAVAMPAYLGFQDRKADKQARANLFLAVQMAEAYRTDHGSYIGMDTVDLRKIDPRLSATLTVASVRRGTYCLTDNVHGKKWSIRGPYRGDAKFTATGDCT